MLFEAYGLAPPIELIVQKARPTVSQPAERRMNVRCVHVRMSTPHRHQSTLQQRPSCTDERPGYVVCQTSAHCLSTCLCLCLRLCLPSQAEHSQAKAKPKVVPHLEQKNQARPADRTEKNAPREEGPPHHHAIEFHYIEQKPTNTARDNVGYDSVRSTTLSEGMMQPAVTRVGT